MHQWVRVPLVLVGGLLHLLLPLRKRGKLGRWLSLAAGGISSWRRSLRIAATAGFTTTTVRWLGLRGQLV